MNQHHAASLCHPRVGFDGPLHEATWTAAGPSDGIGSARRRTRRGCLADPASAPRKSVQSVTDIPDGPSAAAARTLAAAELTMRSPYVWDTAGPDAFDCSDLA